jgi:DNA polymerase
MNPDTRRQQYLQALGIPAWVRRHAAAPTAACPAVSVEPLLPLLTLQTKSPLSDLDLSALQEGVRGCTQCGLRATCKQTVFGVGDTKAQWMFVGEAPGADEDEQGEPFVGRAGQLLNAMILAMGMKREQVYIANVMKCRPPGNRDPQPNEVEQCEPYLVRQIELIRPKLIVALGRHAAHSLLKTELPLARLRGQRLRYHDTPLIVTYHPAYLLRTPSDKKKAWEDLCLAKKVFVAQ